MISVAIPFLNSERTLAAAIRSVFAQTWTDWELILIDDGSTDSSPAIAKAVSDKRVRFVTGGGNLGLPARLNQAVALSRGDLFARMDSDDLMHPDRLAVQARYLAEQRDVHLTGTATYIIDDQGVPRGRRDVARTAIGVDGRPRGVLHPTVTGRTSWFRENPYDVNYKRAEDVELWMRTRRTAVVAPLPQLLFFYREYTSFSMKNYLEGSRSVRRAIRKYGPASYGTFRTACAIAASHAKCAAYRTLHAFHREASLVRARNMELSVEERALALQAVKRIEATRVPGLDAVSHE